MVEMQILNSHAEWLSNRQRIGGSDAATVLGLNPWKDNVTLWLEKTGAAVAEDISEKPYVKYGHEAEPMMRNLFALDFLEYQVDYVDNNMWINDKYPWAHASLDGWLTDQQGRKGILEIKTTNIVRAAQRAKWKNRIPDNYYIQLLHYLLVTEFDFAVLKARLKSDYGGEVKAEILHYVIERTAVEEDIKYLASKEKEFWDCVQERREPALILPEI